MTPDEVLASASNPNFISGIYNYCDRWCERCTMTSRCMVYATEPKIDDQSQEGFSTDFTRALSDSLSLTMQLIQKWSEENGIDLRRTPEQDAAFNERHSFIRKTINASPLSNLAKQYMKACQKWLKDSEGSLRKKEEELQSSVRMDLPNRNPKEDALHISDALEVIMWYHMQISVKIMRAESSALDTETEDWKEEEGFPKDSDGSAKVALIGIDRSIGAFGILLQHFPEMEGQLLSLLTLLERLRQNIELRFPASRGFKRVGFDE